MKKLFYGAGFATKDLGDGTSNLEATILAGTFGSMDEATGYCYLEVTKKFPIAAGYKNYQVHMYEMEQSLIDLCATEQQ